VAGRLIGQRAAARTPLQHCASWHALRALPSISSNDVNLAFLAHHRSLAAKRIAIEKRRNIRVWPLASGVAWRRHGICSCRLSGSGENGGVIGSSSA